MSSYPSDLRYTRSHEWVRADDNLVTVGMTEFAADQLGAVGFVEPAYPGELLRTGDRLCRVRSQTTSADFYMPFIGHINAVNDALSESPGVINSDPYGEGWIVRIVPGDPAEVDALMDAADYQAFLSTIDD